MKVVPAVADDVSLTEAERTRGSGIRRHSCRCACSSRAWQMLLKGIAEVKEAARPLAAAEMVLVRIAYAADLPTPDEVMKSLGDGGSAGARRKSGNREWRWRSGTGAVLRAALRCAARRAARIGGGGRRADAAERTGGAGATQPTLTLDSFDEIIALAAEKRDIAHANVARARRAAGALRGRPARARAGSRAPSPH